ncbi:MAG TPA: HD domain-containing protein [Longimicrobiaceae bacterium]|nr:HD domain-containing protein [Longimicrobiaceae bacterium]
MTSSATNPRTDPRSFCGDAWRLIEQLADGDEITACYRVLDARRLDAKNGKPYLKLGLGDRSGTIDGFVWEDVERWEPLCPADSVVGVRGRVGSYQERLQVRVHWIEPLRPEPADLERLLPTSPRPRERMEAELDALIGSVSEPGLRRLLQRCLGRGTELGRAFRVHPAAKRNHHAYLCGLLEHSVSVATGCHALAEHYRRQGAEVDRDLLVTGALLHDFGKLRELRGLPASGYTDEGQLLGHIVLGIQMVTREAAAVTELPESRLLLLQHLIASHQGRPEWDSPRVPQLREALILHYMDDLDAKLNQAAALLSGVPAGEWTTYDRTLARAFFRPSALAASDDVEPVSSEEARDLVFDLFRG